MAGDWAEQGREGWGTVRCHDVEWGGLGWGTVRCHDVEWGGLGVGYSEVS